MHSLTIIVGTWCRWFIGLPRYNKRILLFLNDFMALCLALWLAFSARLGELYWPGTTEFGLALLAAPIIGIVTFHRLGLYKLVTRFIGPGGTMRLVAAVALAVLIWSAFMQLAAVEGMLPRSVIILYGSFAAGLIWTSRQVAGWALRLVPEVRPATFDGPKINVVIYGAGAAGVQLLDALRRTREYCPVGFIDENRNLWGQMIHGLKVWRPRKLSSVIARERVKEILLAMPEAPRRRQRTIIKRLEKYQIAVKTLPAIADIASGRVDVNDLRSISAEDLLGRDPVPPDPALLDRAIGNKTVLVTGAGGSIGSELVRQIQRIRPKKLVLLDHSEAALFAIERTVVMAQSEDQPIPVVSVLGSVADEALVRRTLREHGVQTIFHAAAYKHVPMVEFNPIAGLKNNTYGTRILATAASDCNVERFVLVSTDKAVRPTSVMGASKRLAELFLQAIAQDRPSGTIFTIVRFGNVLDSSGSVVPLFRQQIQSGGPVLVTHAEIERYFMSISEAAELVIQAGAMAQGGEVFVLDMGKPVKISDLARSMIRLMGREVRDEANPNGDIAIRYTGLRHGEKLYEELLIGDSTTPTAHPRILRSWEPTSSMAELARDFDSLQSAIATEDVHAMHSVLRRMVEGYSPETRHLPESTVQQTALDATRRTLH